MQKKSDTKLKADISELAVAKELLIKGFNVLNPVGDRLSYDLAIDIFGRLVRIQVKAAWFNEKKDLYCVDNRRTRTNRRQMQRKFYELTDFDFAIVYLIEEEIYYIIPVDVFISYGSIISFVNKKKRQRLPRSESYRERWDLIK